MARNADEVLNELRSVGAVGGLEKTARASNIEEVIIDQGPPVAALRDLRGPRAVEAIDSALVQLGIAVEALQGAREALGELRGVWARPEDYDTPEPQEIDTGEEIDPAPETEEPKPVQMVSTEIDEDTYRRAREAALRKIRGEDISKEQLARLEKEDDVPFVGQERALPPGQEPEEISLGTVGTIKPSFPLEGENGS